MKCVYAGSATRSRAMDIALALCKALSSSGAGASVARGAKTPNGTES